VQHVYGATLQRLRLHEDVSVRSHDLHIRRLSCATYGGPTPWYSAGRQGAAQQLCRAADDPRHKGCPAVPSFRPPIEWLPRLARAVHLPAADDEAWPPLAALVTMGRAACARTSPIPIQTYVAGGAGCR
jgi:hypothetical protein